MKHVDEANPAVKQKGQLMFRGIQCQEIVAAGSQTQLQTPGRQILDIKAGKV